MCLSITLCFHFMLFLFSYNLLYLWYKKNTEWIIWNFTIFNIIRIYINFTRIIFKNMILENLISELTQESSDRHFYYPLFLLFQKKKGKYDSFYQFIFLKCPQEVEGMDWGDIPVLVFKGWSSGQWESYRA